MGRVYLKSMAYLRSGPLFLVLVLFCPAIWAQDTEDFDVWDSVSEDLGLITDMAYQVDEEEKDLLVRLGVIGGLAPEYRGSDEHELAYAPDIRIVWKDFLFIKGRKAGLELFDTGSFYGGAFVRYTGGRSEDNEGLEGMGDISRTVTSGAYLNFRFEGLRIKTEVRHDFLEEGHGTLAIMELGSRIPWERPLFYLGVQTTWADSEYMRTFFGVNRFQSMQTGLSTFYPEAGLRDVSVKLSTAYEFLPHWTISGHLRYRHLLSDAADSPIVKDIGTENGFIAGVGLSYTF